MTDINDYEDAEDSAVDEDEAKAAESGAADEEAGNLTDADLAEAETLTVTANKNNAKRWKMKSLRFLARGGRITEVPPDEHSDR